MKEAILSFFIDQLPITPDVLERLKPEMLAFLLPLLHKESGRMQRCLMLEGYVPNKVYIKLEGFSNGSRENFKTKFPIMPFLWSGPAVMTDWRSLWKQKPARFEININAFVDVYSLQYADLRRFKKKFHPAKYAIQALVKQQNAYLEAHERNLHQYTAEERYTHMLEDFGDQLSKISKKHQAAYLGIVPETFSRLLKKLNGDSASGSRSPFSILWYF